MEQCYIDKMYREVQQINTCLQGTEEIDDMENTLWSGKFEISKDGLNYVPLGWLVSVLMAWHLETENVISGKKTSRI